MYSSAESGGAGAALATVISHPMGFEYSVSAIGAVIMQSAIDGAILYKGKVSGKSMKMNFLICADGLTRIKSCTMMEVTKISRKCLFMRQKC